MTALSGGERRRLALAVLVASGANFLVLDEPTNHLDLESREALEAALEAFPGTVLLVSHDRALLDAVAERTAAVEDGTLRFYDGGWADYVARREELAARAAAAETPVRSRSRSREASQGEAAARRRAQGKRGTGWRRSKAGSRRRRRGSRSSRPSSPRTGRTSTRSRPTGGPAKSSKPCSASGNSSSTRWRAEDRRASETKLAQTRDTPARISAIASASGGGWISLPTQGGASG